MHTDTNDFIMKYFGYEFEVMLYLLDLLLIWMYSTMILMTHFLYLITHFISWLFFALIKYSQDCSGRRSCDTDVNEGFRLWQHLIYRAVKPVFYFPLRKFKVSWPKKPLKFTKLLMFIILPKNALTNLYFIQALHRKYVVIFW